MKYKIAIVLNSPLFSSSPTRFFLNGFSAITIGNSVHFKGGFNQGIFKHELTHVRQQSALGVVEFGWKYLTYFLKNFRTMKRMTAYREIVFEKEARDNEKTLEYRVLEWEERDFGVETVIEM